MSLLPSWVPNRERAESLLGNTHRPLIALSIGLSTAYAIGVISWSIARAVQAGQIDGLGAAAWITAVGAIAAAIYGARALENHGQTTATAKVEIAKANATAEVAKAAATPPPPAPGTTTVVAPLDAEITVKDAETGPAEDPTIYGGPRA